MNWNDALTNPPSDHKQKLVIVYNIYQDRSFYALAYYDPANRWGQVGGKVMRWIDLAELIGDGAPAEAIDKILKAEPDLTKQGLDYIERGRIVRILRGLE